MPKKKEYDQKHLTTSQRIHIEKGLNDGLSYATIARKINLYLFIFIFYIYIVLNYFI